MSSEPTSPEPVSVSVVVATYNRPDHVAICLDHLMAQTVAPREVIVVDASPNELTRELVDDRFPDVVYVRNPLGAGTLPTSRVMGVAASSGDVVAFLDDDAYADPDWLARLRTPYDDPDVGGVGGRALNGIPGEEQEGEGQIGMFLPNGTLTGFFAADPGRTLEVDHFIGANMSVRRAALDRVGGIREYYPGTSLREESDTALRLRRAGWRIMYEPTAVVRHVAGPYAKGERFDLRYVYFTHRNHLVLLASTGHHTELRRYLGFAAEEAAVEVRRGLRRAADPAPLHQRARRVAGGTARGGMVLAGLASGLVQGGRAALAERSR